MSTMDHNARSVVAAWRATDSTIFTKHLTGAPPSAITAHLTQTYKALAIHLQHLTADLVDVGFPTEHQHIEFLTDLMTKISARAQRFSEWQRALAQAEAELP